MSKFVEDLPNVVLKDWMMLALGQRLGSGVGRQVFVYELDPRLVIKVEDCGFQNIVEREIWLAIKESKFREWFAPVRNISPCGTVLLMERTLPAPRSKYPKKMPGFVSDLKYSNFGMLNGRLVCHDYGMLCNFLAAVPAKVAMRRAQWWDAKDGSSFNDGAST